MGCVGSKPEESAAVALCRQRCTFLDEAIHQRYALADAHLAYCHSLKNVGVSLHRFFQIHSSAYVDNNIPSPVLNLPNQRKGESSNSKPPPVHSHSNSGSSHLHFQSDSDSGDDDDDDLHSLHGSSPPQRNGNLTYNDQIENLGENYPPAGYPPLNYPPSGYPPLNYQPSGYPPLNYPPAGYPPSGGYPPAGYPPAGYPPAGYPPPDYGSSRYTMNYMRKQPTPSVVYQQRPMNPETIHYGESSYYNNNENNYFYQNQNPNNNNYSNYGEFFVASSSQQPPPYANLQVEASTSTSKQPPPPPPPPPPSSSWDFLNPFETFESYYPPFTPSQDLREVREAEGIPDLEEEEDFYQEEVVKEIHSSVPKFVDGGGGSGSGRGGGGGGGNLDSKEGVVVDDESDESSVSELHYRSGPHIVPEEEEPMEFEVHVVEKGETSRGQKPVNEFHSDSEVVKEIQVQFDRAAESGNVIAKILEVGKVPHNRKHAAYQGLIFILNFLY